MGGATGVIGTYTVYLRTNDTTNPPYIEYDYSTAGSPVFKYAIYYTTSTTSYVFCQLDSAGALQAVPSITVTAVSGASKCTGG